ncbi:MAG: MerR family DNA-binding transcriptional regulator [Acetobacteraceae bacterium]|nr:MerR family DNA-binding transcriptional regulator [Pseudomonadota bacterium]
MAEEQLLTVTEFAEQLGLTARALRFYEDKGLITPRRVGTTRVFSSRDRARMSLILRGKRLGFSLSTIREYLDLYDADPTQRSQLRHLLAEVGKRREQLVAQRQAIDEALAELDDITAQAEAALQTPASRARRAAAE